MATSKEFHDYVFDSLSRTGNVRTRKMMGEYLVYFNDVLVGDICDNMLLLKKTPSSVRLLPSAEERYPYEGSKTLMLAFDGFEDTELMKQVMEAMILEL